MPIPDFQTAMRPLLVEVENGQTRRMRDVVSRLADHFALTEAERSQLIPSGRQALFHNRVAWARTYLVKAGLLESPERGAIRITARGRQALQDCPQRVDMKYLQQYPEFQAFRTSTRSHQGEPVTKSEDAATPLETLESTWNVLRDQLADELLAQVKAVSPGFFERLVLEVLVEMGYGGSLRDASRAVGASRDGGIDGIINEDRLGLDTIYVQAKRWEGTVGRPDVQGFAGSLEGVRARKGVFITTSTFSRDAEEYVKRIEKRIVLIDGQQLVQLMIDHGVGVSVAEEYKVWRIDSDYFEGQ